MLMWLHIMSHVLLTGLLHVTVAKDRCVFSPPPPLRIVSRTYYPAVCHIKSLSMCVISGCIGPNRKPYHLSVSYRHVRKCHHSPDIIHHQSRSTSSCFSAKNSDHVAANALSVDSSFHFACVVASVFSNQLTALSLLASWSLVRLPSNFVIGHRRS